VAERSTKFNIRKYKMLISNQQASKSTSWVPFIICQILSRIPKLAGLRIIYANKASSKSHQEKFEEPKTSASKIQIQTA
jgi:hypothetical protein